MTTTQHYHPFDPKPRRPNPPPPKLACDSQFHVFGPRERFPLRPGAAYDMPTATWQALQQLHATLGIERGVVVQASSYGSDHSVVLDALANLNAGGPRRYVGCANAAAFVERDDRYIAKLHDAGVRGARFSRGGLGIEFDDAQIRRVCAQAQELGWYVKVQPNVDGIVNQLDAFSDLDVNVVLDHMGRADPSAGERDPSLRRVLQLLEKGNFWVMLSLPEKLSKVGAPWDDVVTLARRFVDAAPDRCIWSTDWPHPMSIKLPPNEGDLLEMVYRYAPSPAVAHKILVDNPARLFGFDAP
jgi:2-pyrone-4,6-dicarboxylate lactonase